MDKISFKGLHGQFDFATWQGDSSIVYNDAAPQYGTALHGAPVKITGERTVGLCSTGDRPYGILIRVERDGVCLIGRGGVQEVRISQSATIGTGGGNFPAGTGIAAGASNTVVASATGRGTVVGIEVEYGVKYLYVDLDVDQPAAVTP